MGLRDALNRNPAITTGATAGLIVVALIFIFWTTFGGERPTMPTNDGRLIEPTTQASLP